MTMKKTKIKAPKPLASKEQLAMTVAAVNSHFGYGGVEYSYDKDCSECDANDYHRHCRIIDFEITSIDLPQIMARFADHITDPLLAYCVARLPRVHKLYQKDRWDHSTSGGYYGEELDYINIANRNAIEADVRKLWTLSNKERMFFILTAEYGYIADSIKDAKDFEVITVPMKSLYCANLDYQRALEPEIISEYKRTYSEKMPIGVYVTSGDMYRALDGYHRYVATKQVAPENVKVVVMR
jgi:hypothetical protein